MKPMDLDERLKALPDTKRLNNVTSFEAVILDVIEYCDMFYVILDQTCLEDGEEGMIRTDASTKDITCVREQENLVLHIVHEAPQKGEIAMVERR
jgi:hypothetical protein